MIRVLQVLEATEGGTLTHLRALVNGLPPDEFEQTVAVGLHRGPGAEADLERFTERGVAVRIGPLWRSISPTRDMEGLAWLRALLRTERFDVVHTHAAKAGFLGRRAAAYEGLRAIYSPHGWPFLNPEFGPLKQRAYAWLERLAARWTDHFILVSQGEAEAGLRWAVTRPDRCTVARNGLDLPALDALPPSSRTELGLPEEAFVVLSIGRRAEQKGDRFLLSAWPTLLAQRPGALLLLAGDGPLLDDLRAQARALGIEGSVRFLGRVPQAARLLPAADVFVLPSLFEGCPYSLMEAMALGVACLATDVDGSRELISDGSTGRLVPPADSAALAALLVELAADSAQRARLGAAGRQWARAECDQSRQLETIAAVYRRVVGR